MRVKWDAALIDAAAMADWCVDIIVRAGMTILLLKSPAFNNMVAVFFMWLVYLIAKFNKMKNEVDKHE